ncbi:MAG: hypothetical protein IKK83_03425 [Clostridia bacterium]|nr:hypothetical protein [Clostridia bacterium]
MARITVEEVYRGEKYGVMSAAMAQYLRDGRPAEYDERTWLEMLIVKHALIAAENMRNEGDSISGMTDAESSSSCMRWYEHDNA